GEVEVKAAVAVVVEHRDPAAEQRRVTLLPVVPATVDERDAGRAGHVTEPDRRGGGPLWPRALIRYCRQGFDRQAQRLYATRNGRRGGLPAAARAGLQQRRRGGESQEGSRQAVPWAGSAHGRLPWIFGTASEPIPAPGRGSGRFARAALAKYSRACSSWPSR